MLTAPVAGTKGFGDGRQMDRDWQLLTVTKAGIGPLQPPDPTAPDPSGPPEH
jgi:hypothetical protein